MSYLVLARRFRPQRFDEIIGQEHVTQTLENAIVSDRVAHAFLFSGARGVGKTTAARVLAKALNCVTGPTVTPCGTCEQCVGIAESRSVDVQEIDGASNNSVDDVRALRETVPYQPSSGLYKIYIVDEVHMLTQSAFNALLKTLEEPPPHVKFIFATTEPHKIPVTILSRCQRYDFRLVPTTLILKRLESILEVEGVKADDGALSLLAREAQGSMRDALSLLDRALAFDSEKLEAQAIARLLGVADRQLLFQVSGALLSHDAADALKAVEVASTFGCDLSRFAADILRHLRNLVVTAQCPESTDLIDVSDEEQQALAVQVQDHEVAELHRLFMLFSKATEEIARSSQPRLLLEMTLARLATLEPMRSLEKLAKRLEGLAAGRGPGLGGGSGPVRRPPLERRAAPKKSFAPTRSPAPTPPPRQEQLSTSGRPQHVLSDSAQALWPKLLEQIERVSPPLFHLLRHGEPIELSASSVRIRLPDQPFYRGEAKNPQRLEALRTACRELFGADVQVHVEVAEVGTTAAEREHIESAVREQDRRREAMEHSMVRAALSEFEGAQIKTINLIDNEKK